jgi:hypothetical protein
MPAKWIFIFARSFASGRDNHRVILKDDGLEVAIGSIGTQHGSGATER